MNGNDEERKDEGNAGEAPPAPNETPPKQYVNKDEARARDFQRKMNDQGRENNVDPGHPYEHHGARVRDKGSHR